MTLRKTVGVHTLKSGAIIALILTGVYAAGRQEQSVAAEPQTTAADGPMRVEEVPGQGEQKKGKVRLLRLHGVIGKSLTDVTASDIVEQLVANNISVMFWRDGGDRALEHVVVFGVYPAEFSPGCVVVFGCIGPLNEN